MHSVRLEDLVVTLQLRRRQWRVLPPALPPAPQLLKVVARKRLSHRGRNAVARLLYPPVLLLHLHRPQHQRPILLLHLRLPSLR